MRNRSDDHSYKTLLITLTIIGIFLICIILTQAPRLSGVQQQDNAFAGAIEPSDEEIDPTEDPFATEAPDEPLEDDEETPIGTAKTASPFPTQTAAATFTPFPTVTFSATESPTPAPTFDVDIPGEVTPTVSPTPKPAAKGSSNIGLIIGAVVGTILLIIGIVWVILSRQKQNNDYTMPAPPSNPTYSPYQPDNFNNNPQPGGFGQSDPNSFGQTDQSYTTPYDQYVGTDPNQPPKQ